MDNKKRFPKIVLLFILILLAVLSLMISMMAGSSARRSGDGSELAENVTAGETQEESGRQQGEPTTKTDLEDIPGGIIDQTENVDEETPETAGTDEDVEEARRKREEDERYVQYRRELAGESRKKARSEAESCNPAPDGDPEEGPYIPPTILIVSDLHYISEAVHDGGEAFVNMMLRDDGKLSHCSDAILEAMIDEAIARKVSAVVMSGDNTYNGERENHEELARRLRRLNETGIPVLLVPGNHDINNTNAAVYFGAEAEETEYLHSADEYYEIYEEFYEGANSRDPDSLSYVYPLDATHWMMMLDSALYEDRMHVEGRIRPETLLWMEEVLEAAGEVNAVVVPVAHHNLLSESRFFTKQCVMQNADEVVELLEAHHLPLFLSGHLHVQRIKKHKRAPGVSDDEYGITEIVSSPLSIAPCQYGILSWDDDDVMHYEVSSLTGHMDEDLNYINEQGKGETADLSEPEEGSAEENIPRENFTSEHTTEEVISEDAPDRPQTFEGSAEAFTKAVISSQIQSEFPSLPEDIRQELGSSYADIYYLYCMGSVIDWNAFTENEAYALWLKYSHTDENIKGMLAMARDNTADYHEWTPTKNAAEEAADVVEDILGFQSYSKKM